MRKLALTLTALLIVLLSLPGFVLGFVAAVLIGGWRAGMQGAAAIQRALAGD